MITKLNKSVVLILSIIVLLTIGVLAIPSFISVSSLDADSVYGSNDATIRLNATLDNPNYNVTADFSSVEGLAPVLSATNSNASATWDINNKYSRDASVLLNLSNINGDTDARVIWGVSNLKLKEIWNITYAFYVDSSANGTIWDCYFEELYKINCSGVENINGYAAPYLGFELDTDFDGGADTWVIEHKFAVNKTADSWYLRDLTNNSYFHTAGAGSNAGWNTVTPIDFKSIKDDATLGNANILKIKTYFGNWDPTQISLGTPIKTYVDNLEINNVLRPEPYVLGKSNGDGTYNLTYTIDTQVNDGAKNITLLAIDSSDQSTAENRFTVTIDNIIPALSTSSIGGSYNNYFSPANADGSFDSVNISLNAFEEIDNWVSLSIYNSTNQIPANKVRQYNPTADQSAFLIQSWNGNNTGDADYVPDGNYTVKVKMRDYANNENDTDTGLLIKIDNTAPIVDAGTDNVTNAQVSQDATASDTTTGIATYTWTNVSGPGIITFGTPSAEDTTISADTDGNYTIRLTVVDNVGNSAYNDMILTWDTTPAVVVAGADQSVNEDALVSFNGNSSTDTLSGIASYSWDFDASDGIQVNATGVTSSTTYNNNGTYVVTLTVTDNAGNTNSGNLTVTVQDLSPKANFTFTPTTPRENNNTQVLDLVTFTDASTSVPDSIVSWNWDFGDETNSSDQNPTHSYNLDGTYTITLTVTDADGSTDDISQDITVSFVNDIPTFTPTIPTITVNEDIPLDYNLTSAGFYDEENQLSYNIVESSPNITTSVNGNILTITPAKDWNGTVERVYITAEDGYYPLPVSSNTFTIKVNPVNDKPVINITTRKINEDTTPPAIDISLNTTDVESDPASFTYTAVPEDENKVNCSVSGTMLTYKLAADWFGLTYCNLTANDGTDDSEVFQLQITVENVNDAPTITSTAVTAVTQGLPYYYPVTAIDKDNNVVLGTDTLTYSLTTNPTGMSINPSTGVIVWVPTNSDVGNHNVVVKVEDGKGGSATQSFQLTAANANDAPSAPVLVSPANGATLILNLTTLRWNASTDIDAGDTLNYYVLFSDNQSNLAQIAGPITATEYSVAGLNDTKTYYWKIKVSDGTINVSSQVNNFITSFHNAPTIISFQPADTTPETAENDSLYFRVTASDPDAGQTAALNFSWKLDGAAVIPTVVAAIEGDSVTSTSNYLYEPSYNDTGEHTLVVTVTDADEMTVAKSWTVTVTNTNREPEFAAIEDPLTAVEDEEFTYDIDASDEDVDVNGDYLTFSDNSTLFDIAPSTGIITFTPTNDNVGTHSIKITVLDSHGGTDSTTFTLTVNNTNDAPTITSYYPAYNPLISETSSQLFNITKQDVDKLDSLNVTWLVNDVLAGTADSFTYTPTTAGTFDITVKVSDAAGAFAQNSWTLTVSAVPVTQNYTGTITQLTEEELGNATNVTIEQAANGKIDFGNNVLNLSDVVDLDNTIKIQPGVIAVDTSRYPQLNKPAHIVMKSLGFASTPIVYYNAGFSVSGNTMCPTDRCTNIKYANGILEFDVSGFSTYFVTGNMAPTANAGIDQSSDVNKLVTLDGSASSDPNVNDTLTYAWSQVSGPTVSLSSNSAVKPTFTPAKEGTYVFQLVVNDGTVNSQPDNVEITAFGGILDITDVKLKSVGKKNKLKPGETLTVEVDIKNKGDADIRDIELDVWFEKDGSKLKDDDNDVIEDDSGFDLDAGDDESDLDEEDVTFDFDMPYGIDDGEKYTVYVKAEGTQTNDTSIKYRDLDISETITFEKERHELDIYKAVLNPDMIKCSRNVNVDIGVRDIGENDEDNVKLTVISSELSVNIADTFDIEENPDDNDYGATYSFKVSDEVGEGTYPVLIKLDYDEGSESLTKIVNLEVQDCEQVRKVKEEVVVEKPEEAITKPAVTKPVTPAVTTISFTQTPEYLVVLALGFIVLTGITILALGAVIVSLRKR